MDFRLLGPLAVVSPNRGSLALGPPRRREVLAALLLHRGEVLRVDRLVDLLWPDDVPRTAPTMVHGAVAALRRVLEQDRCAVPAVLVTRDGGYTLIASDQLDAARFERLLTAGSRLVEESPEQASRLLLAALKEWRGPALAGLAVSFARNAATRLEELRLRCVELQVELELRQGRHEDVVAALSELVAAHPLRERLSHLLMVALYQCERQADALAVYRALRQRLVEELGVEPGPELQHLQTAILSHSPGLPRSGSSTPARWRHRSVPAPVSSFVGRDCEQDDVLSLLEAHRLVSLIGTGGSGKTRLAVEVARQLAARNVADVFVVDLTAVTSSTLVDQALADGLGVRAAAGQRLARAVAVALSARPALIVLDNCEHVVEAGAALVQSLLAACDRLRILTTSREPLAVPGEQVYPVRPLQVAAPDDSRDRIASCDAVQLFTARAAAVRPGFTVTAQNASQVLAVCARLDGLPLAIELAAARLAGLPLQELANGLDNRFRLLESTTRDADQRHRSLSATLDWSYTVLSPGERTLFSRLALFPTGFDLHATAAVAGDGELAARDVPTLLGRLVTSSMVLLEDQPDGGTRYRMLQTTRAYAHERLDPQTRAAAAERHAAHYLALAQQAEPRLIGPDSAPWLERLHVERDNLRAALRWFFGTGSDPDRGAALVSCLWHHWDLRGTRDEGLHWVHAALAAVGPDRPVGRMPLLSAGTLLHLGRAEFPAAAGLASEQLAAARAVGHRGWEGDALAMLATIDWAHGRFDRAQQRYEDAVAASLDGADRWRAAMAQAQLARLHRDRREPDAARTVAQRSLALAEDVGEPLACGLALDVLASIEHRWGNDGEARRLVDEALAHYRHVHYQEGEASAWQLAGGIALHSLEQEQARECFHRALDLWRRIGHRAGTTAGLDGLAAVAAATGQNDEATVLARAASQLRAEIGLTPTDHGNRTTVVGPRQARD